MQVPNATSAMAAVGERGQNGRMDAGFQSIFPEVELETTGGNVAAVAIQNVSMTVDQAPVIALVQHLSHISFRCRKSEQSVKGVEAVRATKSAEAAVKGTDSVEEAVESTEGVEDTEAVEYTDSVKEAVEAVERLL